MMQKYQVQIVNIQEQIDHFQSISSIQLYFKDIQNNEIISKVPFNRISGHTFFIQIKNKIHLNIFLVQNNKKKQKVLGKGQFVMKSKFTEYEENCHLLKTDSKEVIFKMTLKINKQYEHEHFVMNSDTEQQEIEKQEQVNPLPPPIIMHQYLKRRKKFTLIKQNEQVIYHEEPKTEIVNNLDNFIIDMDEALSKMKFKNDQNKVIAEMSYMKNPSDDDIKGLVLKTSDITKKLSVDIQTVENEKLKSQINLPNLSLHQSQVLEFPITDSTLSQRGKFLFEYTKQKSQNNRRILKRTQPLTKDPEEAHFNKKELIQPTTFLYSEKEIESDVISHPIKSTRKDKTNKVVNESFELWKMGRRLTQLQNRRKANTKSRSVVQDSLFPSITSNKDSQKEEIESKILRHRKEGRKSREKKNFSIQKSFQVSNQNRLKTQNYHIKDRNNINSLTVFKNKKRSINKVCVKGIIVKFYKQYFQKYKIMASKEIYHGKSLNIFTNTQNIYRTEGVFGQYTLRWASDDCEIQISEFDNLIFELIYEKEKYLIGEMFVSFNQLKNLYTQCEPYIGYLQYKTEPIATIKINFSIVNQFKSRQKNYKKIEQTQTIEYPSAKFNLSLEKSRHKLLHNSSGVGGISAISEIGGTRNSISPKLNYLQKIHERSQHKIHYQHESSLNSPLKKTKKKTKEHTGRKRTYSQHIS